jgi:hypothetical protein
MLSSSHKRNPRRQLPRRAAACSRTVVELTVSALTVLPPSHDSHLASGVNLTRAAS